MASRRWAARLQVLGKPLVALRVLGAGDLAARLARPGWGGQAGCCLGSSSGLQSRDAPFPRANFQSLRRKQELGHDKICGTGAGAAEHPLRSSPEPWAASPVLCKSDLVVLGPKCHGGHRGLSLAGNLSSPGWPRVESIPVGNNSVPFPGSVPAATPKRPQGPD